MIIYLASAYTSGDVFVEQRRYRIVAAVAARLFRKGVVLHCPIAAWHNVAREYRLPSDAASWSHLNLSILATCSELWILDMEGIADSKGVKEELAFAKQNDIPVKWINEDGEEAYPRWAGELFDTGGR